MTDTAIQTTQNSVSIPQRVEESPTYFTPLVDVIETSEAYIFQADLPGVKPDDVDISYDNGTLVIDAKVQPRQGSGQEYVWNEYGVGHFYRQFALGEGSVNPEGIRAELKDGVLELYVPKSESAKTRRIEIKAA